MIVEKCVCAGEKVRKMGYECKDTYVADINYLNWFFNVSSKSLCVKITKHDVSLLSQFGF